MPLLIDVIVPVYNGKTYIAPLLENFRRQGDFSGFRLLFADDGSADGTEEEIRRLAADCPFEVCVFRQENAGVSAARNLGLSRAKAPYVCFFDADDRATPDYMATLLSAARKGEADALLFGQQRTDGIAPLPPAGNDFAPAEEANETALRRFFADPTCFGAVNLLLRRSFLLENGLRFAEGYPYYEDYHFLIRALLRAKKVFYTPAPLYDYIRRDVSAMARFSAERLTCFSLLSSLLPTLRKESPPLAGPYETVFLPHIFWSVLWQAALAAPDPRAFLRFAKKTGADVWLSRLRDNPDKTASLSGRLFLLSPVAFFAAARALGKTRSRVRRASRSDWERLLRAVPAGPEKILVYGMSHMPGGIESYLKTLVDSQPAGTFDFLCDFPDVAYRELLEEKDCAVRFIPPKSGNLPGHLRGTYEALRDHREYRTVYFNILDAGAAVTALVPWAMGRKIAVHSHSGSTDKPLLHKLCKPLLSLELREAVACSKAAAAHMFTKRRAEKALLVPNTVDAARFRFDPAVREEKRRALGIGPEETAVLHVGRLSPEKNPLFLADIAAALQRKPEPYRLLSVGDGEERAALERRVSALGVEDTLLRLGVRTDIPALFSAADVFILPSLYEGLPVVGVEAQAAGLPCLLSDRVTPEIKLTDCVWFLSPEAGAEAWADAVEAHRNDKRADTAEALRRAGYDSADAARTFWELMRRLSAR